MRIVSVSLATRAHNCRRAKRRRRTSKNCCAISIKSIFTHDRSHFVEIRERRRLKKLRKDKLRQLSLQSSTDDPSVKRHKHKQKCGDELCKHRKHKKRRKHKKHHHRELDAVVESPTNSSNKNDEYEFEDDDDDDDEEADADSVEHNTVAKVTSASGNTTKKSTAKNSHAKSVNIKINKLMVKDHNEVFDVKDEVLTEEDVAEDSSGSSYVSSRAVEECNLWVSLPQT